MPASRHSDLSQPIPGYEILEMLGSGGMSSVYKARHKGLDKLVAVKVIRRDQIDPGLALARLTKEARVLSRLEHPNIVRSIDFGEVGDFVYFVMELVDGRSCKQLLIDHGRLAPREVLLIGDRVAQALGYAASHGVIHRDVKPGNILLGKDGSVKLTDFGLARATRDRSLTQDGITVGTPQYMSPEQVKSPRRVDVRSDLYSLGATLYHLATGQPPFKGESVGEILHDVLYASPKPPEQIEPGLPPAFSRVLARLLAKDPRRRYASAADLIADFERVRVGLARSAQGAGGPGGADGEDDESVGLSWQESAEPPPRTVKPWLFAAAALLIAGVTAFALLRGHGERSDPLVEAQSREERLLESLGADLDQGRESAAALLAKIGELKSDGSLSVASARARVDLKSRATAALERELDGAAAAARAESRKALERGDFAAAARAFEEGFAARCAAIVRPALLPALRAAEADPQESIRRRSVDAAAELDALAQRVRRQVRTRLIDELDRLKEALELPQSEGRFVDVRALLDAYPARERAACIAATREELAAAGIVVAPDVTDDALERGWPEVVRAEVEREPSTSALQVWRDDLAFAIERSRHGLLDAVQRAADADAVLAAQGQEGDAEIDPAQRRSELERQLAPQIDALVKVGALPPELDLAWAAYAAKVGGARERAAAERHAAALARLLEDDGRDPGLLTLLSARNVDAARAKAAAASGLSAGDTATWRSVVDDVAGALAHVQAALARQAGSEVELRLKGGVGVRGRLLADATNGTFNVGTRTGLRVDELDLASIEPLLPTAIESEARRAALRYFLGDRKEHAALDATLEALAGDAVIDALRRDRAREKLGEAGVKEALETEARDLRAALDAALAKGDGAAAAIAWSNLGLRRYAETATGRAANGERERIAAQVAEAKRNARTHALLVATAPHASTRTIEGDGIVHVLYKFDDVVEGEDFGLADFGNAIRVENGRLFFSGKNGERAREEGPARRIALDRRAPASLKVELFAPIEEKSPPSFVGLRLGGASVGFYRPNAPQGEVLEPQLAAWFGGLNEYSQHFFNPNLGQVEANVKTKWVARGLERASKHTVELRWLPEQNTAGGTLQVWLDGAKALEAVGAMPAPPENDAIELRSATALQVESLEFTGKLKP